MKQFIRNAGVIALLAASVLEAKATVTVTITPSGAGTYTTSTVSGRTRVEVSASWASSPVTVAIRGASTDDLQYVLIDNSGPQPVQLSIRGNSTGTPIDSVQRVLSIGTGEVWLSELRTSGDLGLTGFDVLDVEVVSQASIGGSVIGNVIVDRTSAPGSLDGMTVTGNLLGDITVTNGSILNLGVGGSIGTALAPVDIYVKKNIESLVAGSIYADVDANIDSGTAVSTFRADTGDFVGSFSARILNKNSGTLTQRFYVAGDLDADIDILDVVKGDNSVDPEIEIGGNLISGRTFRVANSLNSGAVLKLNSGTGLDGQVIINGSNGAGTWSGSVVVGSTTLSPTPNYSTASSSLGGGAVGHVPYQLHGNDCSPVLADPPAANQFLQTEIDGSNDTDTDGGGPDLDNWDAKAVTLRFYGPVKTAAEVDYPAVSYNDMPVIISYIEPITGNPIDVTHRWKIEMNDTNTSNRPAREIQIRGHKWSGGTSDPGMYIHAGTYRITPRLTGAARLFCDGLNVVTPPSVADFEYEFTVGFDCDRDGVLDSSPSSTCWRAGGGCLADYDFSGFVDTEDYDLFVYDFQEGYLWADVDSSGFVDTVDFDAFVEAYEDGC